MRLLKLSTSDVTAIPVADLKKQAEVTRSSEEPYLELLLAQALDQVAADTGRALVETHYQLQGEKFTPCIPLPRPPLIEVLEVAYTAPDGEEIVLPEESYQVVQSDLGATLHPAPGEQWPATMAGYPAAVRITYSAGYVRPGAEEGEVVGALPPAAKIAALLWAAHLYEYREAIGATQAHELPAYSRMLAPLEVNWL